MLILMSLDLNDPTSLLQQGTEFLKNSQPARALPYLERALGLDPLNPEIYDPFQQAAAGVGSRSSAWKALDHSSHPVELLDAMGLLPLVAFGLAALGLLVLLFLYQQKERWLGIWFLGFIPALLSVLLLFGSSIGLIRPAARALERAAVYSGPSPKYLEVGTLAQGAKVRTLRQQEGWYEVVVSSNLRGWVPSHTLLPLGGKIEQLEEAP
jgi:hypothetical protein